MQRLAHAADPRPAPVPAITHGAGQRDQVQYQDAGSGRSLAQGVLDDAAGIEVATARMTTLPLVCCSTGPVPAAELWK